MSANLQKFTRAVHILRNVAVRVPGDAWDNPSCCSGWSAREVAGHTSWVLQNITATTGFGDAPIEQPEAEVAGPDPAATICRSVDACLAALDHPGTLDTVAATPFGEMPIDNFIGTVWIDPLTHAWDIADAAGIAPGIDEATASEAQANLEPVSDMVRGAGIFGPETTPAGPSAVDQFVAFAGRTSIRG
ncbi:TIGR03086 family metal-binding protein [Ilumatobacter nonamiensis]|uniref:TIGR03086 family metal-binding protein n=1 Tax=Ilumatobacter nonamiensis TaxID=467093 RepID=UPI0003468D2E|nr:TIGR03086 family metal-binding protein [Ilumatobacter nonamiensis]